MMCTYLCSVVCTEQPDCTNDVMITLPFCVMHAATETGVLRSDIGKIVDASRGGGGNRQVRVIPICCLVAHFLYMYNKAAVYNAY